MTLRRAASTLLAALLAGPLLLAGCSGTMSSLSGTDDVASDVREIKQRLLEIQRQTTMTRVQLEELRKRVEALEAATGTQPPPAARRRPPETSGSAARPTPSSSVAEPDLPPVDDLRDGQVEETDLAALEDPPDGPAPARPMPAEPEPEPATPDAGTVPVSADGQALYDRGYTLYHQGRYLDAEATFRRFLQGHGDTDLADNAQYWIGEARFARGDTSGSLAAFREVVSRYPRGNKVADALLKAGQCLERLGDVESARASYREVVERFPGSAARAVAEERLAALP